MNKIRVLINDDFNSKKYIQFLQAEKFSVDLRPLFNMGIGDSPDTLSEYDAIILNHISPKTLVPFRVSQIMKFLKHPNKLFVFVLNKLTQSQYSSNSIVLASIMDNLKNSSDSLIQILNYSATGSTFTLTDYSRKEIFNKYLTATNKEWKISLRQMSINDFIKPLALNTDDDIVAFKLEDKLINSENAFIPWLSDSEDIFWETISNWLLKMYSDFEDVAEWVSNYSFPKLIEVNKKIEDKSLAISNLESVKLELEKEMKQYERIRNVLLYHDGDLLRDVCRDVLIEIGIKAMNGKAGREDLAFIYEENHFLIEVKGCEKSANKAHVKQVAAHVVEYSNELEVEVKGILLINAWRKLPPEERNTSEKPIFPNEIMKLVELSKITLMTTQQLFVAYCEHLSGVFNLQSFIAKLKDNNGEVVGYKNIANYQISSS